MSTFITRFDTSGPGVRLAVKDLIDMEGVPTTAGCRAVANEASPATRDAACLARGPIGTSPHRGPDEPPRVGSGGDGREPVVRDAGEPPRPPSSCPEARRAARRWRWPPTRPTSPTAATPADRSGSPRRAAAWPGSRRRGVAFPSKGSGPCRRASTPWAPWPATWAASCSAWSSSSRDSPSPIASGFTVGRFRVDADPLIDAAIDRALAVSDGRWPTSSCPRWHEATAAAGLLLVAEAWETDRELVARRPEEIGSRRRRAPEARSVASMPRRLASAQAVETGVGRDASRRSSDASTSSPPPR